MQNFKIPLLITFILLLFSGFSYSQASTDGCADDCRNLIVSKENTDCPCRMDLSIEVIEIVNTVEPCHCPMFRSNQGVYVRKMINREGEMVVRMSKNLGFGTLPRILMIQSEETNKLVNDIFLQKGMQVKR